MKKIITISTIIILIVGLFLGLFVISSYYKKSKGLQNDLDDMWGKNKQLIEINKELSQKSIPINLSYNNRTGELFFADDIYPSVCVWTMLGERESVSIVVTKAGGYNGYNYNETDDTVYYAYDYKYNSDDDSISYDKNSGNFVGFTKYDWIGHLLNNEIKIIKDMKFLPPRAPIYVTCVDSQNRTYYGSIGEYE